MTKDTTTFGLDSKKLVDLLKIGEDAQLSNTEIDKQQKKMQLLHDRLAASLPHRFSTGENISKMQTQLLNTLGELSSESIGKLLLDSKTDINSIRMIKEYAGRLSKCAKSEAEYQTANVIYYIAIADALIFHDLKITRYTYKSLYESFSKMLNTKWISQNIIQLFTQAAEISRQKLSQDQRRTL